MLAVTPSELAASKAPLSYLYEHYTGRQATVISIIAMFAIINGAMIQVVMASRVLYGLASRGQLPGRLARVNARTRTPLFATALVVALVMILALAGQLASLAEATSLLMLAIFTGVNLALWRIKKVAPVIEGIRCWPRPIPLIGALICLLFIGQQLFLRLA